MRHASVYLADIGQLSEAELQCSYSWLSAGELQRYQAFVRDERRQQFLAGRFLLRQALGQLLSMPAAAVALLERSAAAPVLALPDHSEVGFSISHSGGWVACAVSANTQLGLDIERINLARDVNALAPHVFEPDDYNWWLTRPDASRAKDFYQLWTSNEARYKLHAPCAQSLHLPYANLSITLCSSHVLSAMPALLVRG